MKALKKTVSELDRSVQSLRQQTMTPRGREYKDNTELPKQPKRACFLCGSEEHLKANCPKNQKYRFKARENQNHQAKSVVRISSGLYADCKINNFETECLIDTGATLSIIASKAWDIITQSDSILQPFSPEVFTASGSEIEVKGKTTVMIEICGIQCPAEMIVADIDVDVIIGLDFLRKHNCKIDVTKEKLKIKNKFCNLKLTGKLGCYRVTVSRTIEIPSMSEMIIEGTVCSPALRQNDLGIIELTKKSYQTGS